MSFSAPEPSVKHLLTLFRQISGGEIRIPAFQREFVWKEKQILELLNSVRAGYPVGSILTWYVEEKLLKIASTNLTAFPDVDEKYPTSYILDGMQRISSLYGVFHFGDSSYDERFNVWFNITTNTFRHQVDLTDKELETSIPLASLFVPKKLLEHQSRLAARPDGDELIDGLLSLQSAFQDYMIPVVQIRGREIKPIVAIFEKINSTGTALSSVDFMRAITWSDEFDLSDALEETSVWLEESGHELPQETIIKCIALLLRIPPSSDELLELRNQETANLKNSIVQFKNKFLSVAEFLRNNLNIPSSSIIPYEGQILVLFRAIGMDDPTPEELELLANWYWSMSFNEGLRGKPDHYVVRATDDWQGLISGRVRGLEPRLKLTSQDFIERRLIKGKALSSAAMSMFAKTQARSLTNGHVMDLEVFMANGDPKFFSPIFSVYELEQAGINLSGSSKLLANVIVTSPDHFDKSFITDIILGVADAANAEAEEILASQLISTNAIQRLREGDTIGFLNERATVMLRLAQQMTGQFE